MTDRVSGIEYRDQSGVSFSRIEERKGDIPRILQGIVFDLTTPRERHLYVVTAPISEYELISALGKVICQRLADAGMDKVKTILVDTPASMHELDATSDTPRLVMVNLEKLRYTAYWTVYQQTLLSRATSDFIIIFSEQELGYYASSGVIDRKLCLAVQRTRPWPDPMRRHSGVRVDYFTQLLEGTIHESDLNYLRAFREPQKALELMFSDRRRGNNVNEIKHLAASFAVYYRTIKENAPDAKIGDILSKFQDTILNPAGMATG